MPYRRIDLTLSSDHEIDAAQLEEQLPILDLIQQQDAANGRRRLSLLANQDKIEPILQELRDRWGHDEKFRAVVLDVLAIVPHPEHDEEADSDAQEKDVVEENEEVKLSKNRISREELLDDLTDGSTITKTYLMLVGLSSVIASVGLVRDSPAMVIGAMVIAPLLLPNMSLALGTTLGNWKFIWRSFLTGMAGIAVCLSYSVLVGLTIDFDPSVHQIASRTSAGYSDVALALAAGCAGALAVISGVSANLIGVMVAVALLPPMVALGLLIGRGMFTEAVGTTLLLFINLTCINLAAVVTFISRGVRPSTFYEQGEAKKTVRYGIYGWCFALVLAIIAIWLVQQFQPK